MTVSAPSAQGVDNATIINLLKLAHAHSQKLAESWIPYTKEELEARGTDQNDHLIQRAQDKLLSRSEYAGLGAETLQSSTTELRGLSTSTGSELEKLRKQLLGRKAAEKSAAKPGSGKTETSDKISKVSAPSRSSAADDSDEDEGRSSVFSSKRSEPVKHTSSLQPNSQSSLISDNVSRDEDQSHAGHPKPATLDPSTDPALSIKSNTVPSKRSQSFLDEMIADRAKRKSKKRKNKHDKERGEPN